MATLGEYIPNANTKLLLHLNGNSTDSSGNSNNGTDTSIIYSQANGRFGQGAGFNGTTSYISVAHNANITFTDNFSVSFFLNTPTSASYKGFVSKGNIDNFNLLGWGIIKMLDDKIRFEWFPTLYTANRILSNSGVLSNTWTHCVVTVSSGTARMYIDGIQQTATASFVTNSDNNALIIGASSSGLDQFNSGKIDEVIVENVAWSAAKIAKYYTMTKGRFGIV